MVVNPLDSPLGAIQVLAVGVLAVAANRKRLLNASGAFAAFVLGTTIIVTTNIFWLLLLMSLLVLAGIATRTRYEEKAARGTGEAREGVRRTRNVLANGLVPTLIALAQDPIDAWLGAGASSLLFVGSVAAAAADTFASEFGGLSEKTVLITTGKPVPPGTDGGVSLAGQIAALAGSLLVAAIGIVLLSLSFTWSAPPGGVPLTVTSLAAATAAGFIGCQMDSLLGALFEVRGILTKEEVNFLGIASGSFAVAAWLAVVGGL
jgi:uncharacterized protein (TIGR00297 family)